jgi:hypothetical protein
MYFTSLIWLTGTHHGFFIPKLGLEVVVLIFYLFSLLFSYYFLIHFLSSWGWFNLFFKQFYMLLVLKLLTFIIYFSLQFNYKFKVYKILISSFHYKLHQTKTQFSKEVLHPLKPVCFRGCFCFWNQPRETNVW